MAAIIPTGYPIDKYIFSWINPWHAACIYADPRRRIMLGLRQKITLGFSGLLAITLIIGIQGILNVSRLGGSVDVILRENYRSVIACQRMKEALERIDSGLLFTLLGEAERGSALIHENEAEFEEALQGELDTITPSGEAEKASRLRDLFGRFRAELGAVADSAGGVGA